MLKNAKKAEKTPKSRKKAKKGTFSCFLKKRDRRHIGIFSRFSKIVENLVFTRHFEGFLRVFEGPEPERIGAT